LLSRRRANVAQNAAAEGVAVSSHLVAQVDVAVLVEVLVGGQVRGNQPPVVRVHHYLPTTAERAVAGGGARRRAAAGRAAAGGGAVGRGGGARRKQREEEMVAQLEEHLIN